METPVRELRRIALPNCAAENCAPELRRIASHLVDEDDRRRVLAREAEDVREAARRVELEPEAFSEAWLTTAEITPGAPTENPATDL